MILITPVRNVGSARPFKPNHNHPCYYKDDINKRTDQRNSPIVWSSYAGVKAAWPGIYYSGGNFHCRTRTAGILSLEWARESWEQGKLRTGHGDGILARRLAHKGPLHWVDHLFLNITYSTTTCRVSPELHETSSVANG